MRTPIEELSGRSKWVSTLNGQVGSNLVYGASTLLVAAGVATLGGVITADLTPVLASAPPLGLLAAKGADHLTQVEQKAAMDVPFQTNAPDAAKSRVARLQQRQAESYALAAAVVAGALAGFALSLAENGFEWMALVSSVGFGLFAGLLVLVARKDGEAAEQVQAKWRWDP